MSYTALNHPQWMKTPAPWFIRGKNSILDRMLDKANSNNGVIVLLNFSKENIKYSSFDNNKKFVCIALCTKENEYYKVSKVWNRYGEMFDAVILVDKSDVSNIFDDVSKCVERKYNINVSKFDCIIMNPPYERNLHLKIFDEAIKHLKDDNSKCINLSPIRWLQDPLAKYNKKSAVHKFKNSVYNHIDSYESIDSKSGCDLFEIGVGANLGITVAIKEANINKKFTSNSILDKVISKMPDNCKNHIICSKPMKYACVVPLIVGGNGRLEKIGNWMLPKNKAFYFNNKNCDGLTYEEYRNNVMWGNVKPRADISHIEFDTEIERENFYNSWATKLMIYLMKTECMDVNVHTKFLPYMEDYTKPWTDEGFYKFFNITPEEQKLIEDTMQKYS